MPAEKANENCMCECHVEDGIMHFMPCCTDSSYQANRDNTPVTKMDIRIGMLRQWLNEKPADRLVTNEDIKYWLDL